MRSPEVKIASTSAPGEAAASRWGCDLSYDYVKINADYTSLIVHTPDGGVAKDDRLTNYSPAFKGSLLVEALSYISRFAGKRCVIKYGGAAMVKDSLKEAFCDDINLLRVGRADADRRARRRARRSPARSRSSARNADEFIDGVRITNASDLKVVEMVLSGAVNTELVSLLNREGAHAVGISGKDGALLRAKKRVDPSGRDLGQIGVITGVNKQFLEMLLEQDYVPVISPIGLGDDGQGYNLHGDDGRRGDRDRARSREAHLPRPTRRRAPGRRADDRAHRRALREQLERGSISGGMRGR